jgi:hypothetical protein
MLVALTIPRWHRAPVPVSHVVLVVSVLSALLAVSLRLGLRPLQAPPTSAQLGIATLIGAIAAPFLFAILPIAGSDVQHLPGVSDTSATAWCFGIGAFVGVLVVVGLRALDRGAHGSRSAALFAAAAGGLAANVALELHCALTVRSHLVIGHAGVALALLLAYGLFPRRGER